MYNVQNKTVMITGAASGLGYKYAEILLRNGAKSVAVVDLPTSDGQNAAATFEKEFGKGRAVFFACDLTKADELKKTFDKIVLAFKGLDIVINNAGMMNDNCWEQTIDLNIKALVRCSMLAFDHMGKQKGGKGGVLVNIASIVGLDPAFFLPVYSASKHAVLGFSQSLAAMYNKTGIRVGIMCPGVTDTALIANITDKVTDSIKTAMSEDVMVALSQYPTQSTDNVASAMLDLIQKGENGAVWVSEGGQPPYAVEFTHYSKRALSV